jgi:hypothetical protein
LLGLQWFRAVGTVHVVRADGAPAAGVWVYGRFAGAAGRSRGLRTDSLGRARFVSEPYSVDWRVLNELTFVVDRVTAQGNAYEAQPAATWPSAADGYVWLLGPSGLAWLTTGTGLDWLMTPAGQAWLMTPAGHDWLMGPDGQAWLMTPAGHDWLMGPDGQAWLMTPAGHDWQASQAD